MRGYRLFVKTISDLIPNPRHGMRRKRSFPFWPPVLVGMVVLLAAVAVLQYRWTSEVSDADEFRVGTELESLMMRWHLDLYGEFSAICVAMQVGPDSGARDTWHDYLERYAAWSRAGQTQNSLTNIYKNPDLVDGIYIWETSRNSQPRFLRLNPAINAIDTVTIRPELVPLLSHLKANSENLPQALNAWQLPSSQPEHPLVDHDNSGMGSLRSTATTGWQFDEGVPAIVHPIVHHSQNQRPNSENRVDWIVIVLNLQTVRNRILPELARRYFGRQSVLDYKVAVVATGTPSRVIYSSDPGFGVRDVGALDSTMNIFGPPPESVEGQFWQTVKNSQSLRSEQWHSFSGPVWFPTFEYGSHPDPWVLVLQRRAGPLQSVVERVRRRNLAISAVVLVLLAVNMGVVLMAGIRAHSFAQLQMDFVASVSHELRTPLTAIFSAAENIKDGVVRGKSNLVHYGSLVMSQTRQLMDHVDRILLFASIRSGRERYNLHAIPVGDIVRIVHGSMAEFISDNECSVAIDVEPGLPCVLGDSYAIRGCLENLITNAIKYSRNDRQVQVSAELHNTDNGAKEVRIGIRDHGIGISSSELQHVFEPFYRSPAATAAQIHGTGLGLFLAKHLAEAMGGRISVVSDVGVGSTFTLHLAIVETEQTLAQECVQEVMR